LFALTLAPAPAAHAQVTVQKTGWWTRSAAAPAVPPNGLAVGEAPDGYLTVSAFQVDTGGGASNVAISLGESAGQGQQGASIQVCTTDDDWAQVEGGDLTLAPRPACPSDAVRLARDSKGVWTADLNTLLAGKTGAVSLMLIPGPNAAPLPGGARAGAFQVSFQPPTVTGTVVPRADTSASSESATTPAFDTVPEETFSPALGGDLTTPEAAPSLAAAPASSEVAAEVQPGNANVNFPVRLQGTPTKRAKSRLVIIGWVVLAGAIGALAAGWHYAREAGTFERLLPIRTGGSLLTPPSD
jgi:hypothetical protein